MTSSAVNWLADVLISKDKSEWEEILFYYRALGFSEDVAFMEALKEQGRQMLKEGAAGAITGAAAAGGRLAWGQIKDGIQNHKNYREAVQNGRQYYALNQLSQGDLARSLGNMNVEQAYRTMSPEAIMETSGLKPRQAQYLLENTGYSPEGRAARPSVNQVYSMLRSTGLNHQETQALMKSKGYSLKDAPQLPNLLGDDTGEVLQRDEGLSGEMFELPKIGEESENSGKRLEKRSYSDILKGDYFSQIEEEVDIPELYRNDFSDYEELTLTEQEADAFSSLHDRAGETGKENAVVFVNGQMTEIFTSDFENRVGIPHELLENQNVKIFHNHTNCTTPSGADLEMLTNENVSEIGVITANGDIYTVSVGSGERPSPEEFRAVADQIQREADREITGYPDFLEWSIPQRNYMAIKEKTYQIVRHFGWTMKGGKG